MYGNSIFSIYNIHDVDEFSLKIKNEVFKLSKSYIGYLENRYSCDLLYEQKINDQINRLTTYGCILERIKDQFLSNNNTCLNSESFRCLIEKINNIIGRNCISDLVDYNINKDSEEEWVIKCPFCRTYENWEKWAKFFAGKLNLELNSNTEVLPNLILEISRKIITPNVLLAISAYTEVRNNLNLEVSRSVDEIKLDFQLLLEKVPSFDLNLSLYTELINNHKLSFDMVKTIYDEGLSLELCEEEVQLKTPVNAYTLSELSGNINPSYLRKFGMDTTINKKDLLQDYK